MVGIKPVPRSILTAAGEQHEDRDMEDIPHPAAVGTEQAVLKELRSWMRSSAEVRGKIPEVF